MKKIHPTAVIEDGAILGDDVEIGAFCYIGNEVKIGRGTRLHTHVALVGNVEVGEENEFFHSVCLGNIPQDTSFDNPEAKLVIGNKNKIRENVSIHLPSKKGGLTFIGNENYIMANSHLGHDVHVGNHVAIVVGSGISGYVRIDDYAYVSGLVGIHQFCHIGSYAIVSGGSKVSQDVPPYMIASGLPASIHGLNMIAFRRAGMQADETRVIKKIYRVMYRESLSHQEALQKLEEDLLPTLEAGTPAYQRLRYFLDFSAQSKRGAMPHIAHRPEDYAEATME